MVDPLLAGRDSLDERLLSDGGDQVGRQVERQFVLGVGNRARGHLDLSRRLNSQGKQTVF